MPTLEMFMLGTLDIRCDGQPVPEPPTLKSQSLLAYLVLHRNRPQPRERLAGLFWGDRPERKARRSLTTALWHIQRSLAEKGYLLTDPHTVQFDAHADLWLDVDEFRSLAADDRLAPLESAAALYRGGFLDGFYDDWIINERYRLETQVSSVLTRLMVGQEATGEQEAALSTARRLLELDPLREDAHRLAMRALCRLGQRNTALEQYRRCQGTVRQELGAEPMVETTELYHAILDGRLEIGPAATAAAGTAAEGQPRLPRGTHPLDARASSSLVGREPEMVFLREGYQGAKKGHGALTLIEGEAGVGKTRLVGEFADQLRWQGDCVLWGRCFEFERMLPYQPVAEALRTVVRTMTPSELEDLPAWILAEVARLVPEILEKRPELDVTPTIRSEQERMRLFEALVRFLGHLSLRGGLLLVLEDLHWATESTLQLVHYLARHLAAHSVLIVGTLRPEAVGRRHPLAAMQQELAREGVARMLRLEPLSPQAVKSMVLELSGTATAAESLADRLYEETEGNPLFLMEIIKALFEAQRIVLSGGMWSGDFARIREEALPLPAGVSETIEARVRWLDDGAQQALRLAAVLGREFDFELLDTLWGRGEEATLEALDQLLRRRLIGEGTGALARDYAFTHHKIQEVVYTGVPERLRQRLHAKAGAAMERLVGPQWEELAGELAFHFLEGARHDPALRGRAVDCLLQAGDRARLAYAQQEAIGYYEQALDLLKQQRAHERAARTLMKLGLTYHNAFDFGRARQAYDEGIALWQRAGESAPPSRQQPAPHALRVPSRGPINLDPATVYDESSMAVIHQLFSGLVDLSPDMGISPDVARTWEILEGGRTYIFHLREDVQWSDGVPVTAADFDFALKRMMDRDTGAYFATLLYDFKGARAFHQGEVASAENVGVRAVDDVTLRLELEAPTGHFLNLLYRIGLPVPRHIVQVHGDAWCDGTHLVTNGPFNLEAWQPGQSLVLARNPAYRGRFDGNVERLRLSLFPSGAWSEALTLYERDQLDAMPISGFPTPELEAARQRHDRDYVSSPQFETYVAGFDVSQPPFDDVRVRRALAQAIDRELLADVILRGHVSPATGGFVPPGMPGHSAGIGLPHDPDRARKLLTEAGFPGGRGLPVVEAILSGFSAASICPFLVAQWHEKLGVGCTCQQMDLDAAIERTYREPPHIVGVGFTADYPDPYSFLKAAVSHTRTFTHWKNETYDRLVDEAGQPRNQEQRMHLYRQAEEILLADVGIIPLVYGRSHMLVKPWIRNYFGSRAGTPFWKDVIIEPH